MQQYIIATFEGTTISPKGNRVENLQILGLETGESPEDAWKHLINKNRWISESGFGYEETIFYPVQVV